MKQVFCIMLAFVCAGSMVMASGNKPQFIKEGVWRGVFNVNKALVPFNFELKGKDAEHAIFSLINGNRRDEFHIQRITDDSLLIEMNTYDATLLVKIESTGKVSGEYRSIRGNALPFRAEADKHYRFVEPGKCIATSHNLSGKWELQIHGKEPIPNRIGLLKQDGNKLTGVILCVDGDSRELEGIIQGNRFELSGFTGPCPIYLKGRINNDQSLTGELSLGSYNRVTFDGAKNEEAELPDLYKLSYVKEADGKLN